MRSTSGLRRFVGLTALVAFAAAVMMFAGGAGAIVAGAGYTTTNIPPDPAGSCFNGPGVVNCNIYAAKTAVWINGGPTNGTSALSDGTYFFVVGVPGGENSDINDAAVVPDDGTGTALNLSDDFDAYTNRTFTVANHHISGTAGTHDFVNGKIRLAPYSDTTNPGGEYFVAICRIDQVGYPADPSACKYDNFKIKSAECTENCTPTPFGVVNGAKYYDADLNGLRGGSEVGIPNWPIDFTDGVANTVLTSDPSGNFTLNLSPDTYSFNEEQATNNTGPPFNLPIWIQTGEVLPGQFSDSGGNSTTLNNDKTYTVGVVDGGTTNGLLFGNVCLGAGGGLTLGFWSNKNGQALETASDFAMLTALNLRNANGTARDFTGSLAQNKSALNSWLLSANATNMAYMLSAQLAAMELNVAHGLVNGNSQVFVGGSFMTVSNLMAEANRVLGNPIAGNPFDTQNGSVTVAASALRTYQETLKSGLDAGNNNKNFVQSSPATCPAPTFP
jgi:hypothetical protein